MAGAGHRDGRRLDRRRLGRAAGARDGGRPARAPRPAAGPDPTERGADVEADPALAVGELARRLPAEHLEAEGEDHDQDEGGERLAQRLGRRPDEQEEHDHGEAAPRVRRLAQVRRQRPPEADGPRGRPGEPGREHGDDAVGDGRAGDADEQRGLDLPRGLDGRLDRVRRRERVDELRPGEAADHQHEDPRDHEPDPGGSQRLAPPAAPEPDREARTAAARSPSG